MTHYFLDSSALIKRYVAESGSRWVQSIAAYSTTNVFVVAQIARVEVVSGIMRRRREGTISESAAPNIVFLAARHASRRYIVIDLSQLVIQRAEICLQRYPLRAYDAIQLASALEGNQKFVAAQTGPLIFVSADNRLLSAATSEGLAVDNPNLHP